MAALEERGRIVLTAPTGSGKSTLLPPAMARQWGLVWVLEPRRVVARALASFVARQWPTKLGDEVGYLVRFDQRADRGSRLVYMTPGVFLRLVGENPRLEGIAGVVIDEFHERDILNDVALAILVRLIRRDRPDLRVAVMSATLDAARIASYLDAIWVDAGAASVRETEDGEKVFNGRCWVEIRYRPGASIPDILREIAALEERLPPDQRGGAVLIFQPGKAEIAACRAEVERTWPDAWVCPLHAEMDPAEQDRAFRPAPPGRRKVVIATNVAETGITVPDVVYVIDTGTERIPVYDPQHGFSALRIVPISRASAAQRAGRAGRVRDGVVFRLWSREDHLRRPESRLPEIRRADLAGIILQLRELGVDLSSLELPDPPDPERVREAEETLRLLGALDPEGRLTPVGRRMARLPLEPHLARAVVEAEGYGPEVVDRVIRAVAAFHAGRIFLRPEGKEEQAREAQRAFRECAARQGSDLAAFGAALEAYLQDRRTADRAFLSRRALEEAAMAADQIRGLIRRPRSRWDENGNGDEAGGDPVFSPGAIPAADGPDAAFRRALAAGMADRLYVRTYGREYLPLLREGPSAVLDKESAVQDQLPELVVAAEVREVPTRRGGRLYLLVGVTRISPEEALGLIPEPLREIRTENARYDPARDRVVAVRVVIVRTTGRSFEMPVVLEGGPEAARELARVVIDGAVPWTLREWSERARDLDRRLREAQALLRRDPARLNLAIYLPNRVRDALARRLEGARGLGEADPSAADPDDLLAEVLGQDYDRLAQEIRDRFPDRLEIRGATARVEYGPGAVVLEIPPEGLLRLREEDLPDLGRPIYFRVDGVLFSGLRDARLAAARKAIFSGRPVLPDDLDRLPEPGTPLVLPGEEEPVGFLALTGDGLALAASPEEAIRKTWRAIADELACQVLEAFPGVWIPEETLEEEALRLLEGRSLREIQGEWEALISRLRDRLGLG